MTMTMLTKEKIKRVFYFLEDEMKARAQSLDEKVADLIIPVRRILSRTSPTSKNDLLKTLRKLRSDDVLRIKDIDDLEKSGHTTTLDNIEIEIYPQKFFEYKKIIFGEGPKPDFHKPGTEDSDLAPSNNRPFCVVENGWGLSQVSEIQRKN